MNTHVKTFIIILVLGVVGILGVKFLLPVWQEQEHKATSDAVATKGSIAVGVDNWIGYFPLCSDDMSRAMRHTGYVYSCEEDAADYRERFRRVKAGELQFAVATVDSYLLAGKEFGYPATIVAVIDESKGGDAIVAHSSKVKNLEALKSTSGLRVAYTPASPSEHLLKAIGSHFDIPQFRPSGGGKRIETDGSTDALKRLLDDEADLAVLWEPDVSRALSEPGIVKLIGSEDTERLIVDILLVNRDFSRDHPEAVSVLLENYFKVRGVFADDSQRLRKQVREKTGLDATQVDAMLDGVSWATLNENGAVWFDAANAGPFAEEGLVDAIQSAARILVEAGDFSDNPLPDGDPYRITNRKFITDILEGQGGSSAGSASDGASGNLLERKFSPLDADGWARLKEVGTLKVKPIAFQSGTASLSYDGKLELDQVVERLKHYPNFRLLVKGHTGVRGDANANRALSQERAEAVSRYMMVTYNLDVNRVATIGYGGSQPLTKKPGESDRAWGYRLPRVELALLGEAY